MTFTRGRHRLFDARRRPGWSFVMGPTGVWHSQWRGTITLHTGPRKYVNDPTPITAISIGMEKGQQTHE